MLGSFNLDKTYQYLLIALAFLLPLTVFGGNLIIVIIVILWLISGHYKSKFKQIINSISGSTLTKEGKEIVKVVLNYDSETKRALELIGLPHLLINKEFIVIEKDAAITTTAILNIKDKTDTKKLIEQIASSP